MKEDWNIYEKTREYMVKYLLVLYNPPSSPLKIRGDRGGLGVREADYLIRP